MTNNEANKVIAEYMGYEYYDHGLMYRRYKSVSGYSKEEVRIFTSSLDALVPVWERLEYLTVSSVWQPSGDILFEIRLKEKYKARAKTIQEAATYCTAKAILALKEK